MAAETPDGAALIAAERQRQIQYEGYTSEHDRQGAVTWAAVCYAAPEPVYRKDVRQGGVCFWEPWPPQWWRTEGDRVSQLVKAGALIAAEIDRLNREARHGG
jgi:hypothetical protein